jgi:hypothetical protein
MRPGTTRVSLTDPRASVPASLMEHVAEAVTAKLADVVVGHPAEATTTMGPLTSLAQLPPAHRSPGTHPGLLSRLSLSPEET